MQKSEKKVITGQSNLKNISVCTLNYSGISSPYQFYTQDQIKKQKTISFHFKYVQIQKFKSLCPDKKQNQQKIKQYQQDFLQFVKNISENDKNDTWEFLKKQFTSGQNKKNILNKLQTSLKANKFQMGTLDTVWNKSRYAPCHRENVGVQSFQVKVQNQKKKQTSTQIKRKLLNQGQFLKQWNKVLTQSLKNDHSLIQYIKKKGVEALIHLYMCRIFDLCCFVTLAIWHTEETVSFENYILEYAEAQRKTLSQQKIGSSIYFMDYLFIFHDKIEKEQLFGKYEDAQKYVSGQKKFFSQEYLFEDMKIKKILENMSLVSHDIYCFQQVSENFVNVFTQNKLPCLDQKMKEISKKYHIIEQKVKQKQKSNSIILISKNLISQNKFDQTKQQFLQKFLKQFPQPTNKQEQVEKHINFNKDSVFAIFQNNANKYLVLNVHLTSKKKPTSNPDPKIQYNQDQVIKVLQFIEKVISLEYIPIFVGDFNSDISKIILSQKLKKYHFFPKEIEDAVTTNKMRTMMQPQGNKAQVQDKSAKDFILSTMKMSQQKVVMLKHKQVENFKIQYNSKKNQVNKIDIPVLPTSGHPFDHFAVVSVLQLLAQKKTT